jgi:hypothetical protein
VTPDRLYSREPLAWGRLHSADFEERTITISIQGDMPHLTAGRYAFIEAENLTRLVRAANLYRESQAEKSA